MKLLVVDECCFTRLGITHYLTDTIFASVISCPNIDAALSLLDSFKPSHILVNLSHYCRHAEENLLLQSFIMAAQRSTLYIYLNLPYPDAKYPICVASNAYLFSKSALPQALKTLQGNPTARGDKYDGYSLFSPQELIVMKYWMSEMPNHRIAKKLSISTHTVYVHKRHITEKIHVRNRLEFYSLYNVLRYFYPPTSAFGQSSERLVAV